MTFSADIGPISIGINSNGLSVGAAGGSDLESPFELRAGSLINNELRVRSLRGREALSESFRFDIEFHSDLEPDALRPILLGQSTTLILRRDGAARRVVTGITVRLRGGELRGITDRAYKLRLMPRIWLLRRRRDSRIFQDMSVVEVIRAVLKRSGHSAALGRQAQVPLIVVLRAVSRDRLRVCHTPHARSGVLLLLRASLEPR